MSMHYRTWSKSSKTETSRAVDLGKRTYVFKNRVSQARFHTYVYRPAKGTNNSTKKWQIECIFKTFVLISDFYNCFWLKIPLYLTLNLVIWMIFTVNFVQGFFPEMKIFTYSLAQCCSGVHAVKNSCFTLSQIFAFKAFPWMEEE